jgi:hypothetical protein
MKSRYIPFTQQRYLCVPTCLQMVMCRHGIPLQSAEEIGYALGLTVPQADAHLYEKARTGERPSAGWGTRINEPEFEINKGLKSLGIPLQVDVDTEIANIEILREKLQKVQDANSDALVCFDWGVLWDSPDDIGAGHLSVFDRLEGNGLWIVDPGRNDPKFRHITLANLYEAIHHHGPNNSGGIWFIKKV